MGAQEFRQVVGQEGVGGMGVGPQADLAPHAPGERGQFRMHLFEAGEHLASVPQQGLTRRGGAEPPGPALEQGCAQAFLQQLEPVAGRGWRQMHPLCGTGQVARFGNGDKQAQVGEVVTQGHGRFRF